MKVRAVFLLVAMAFAIFADGQQNAAPAKSAPANDQQQIRAEAEAWFAAGAAKDAAKFATYYAPDANLFPPNEKIVSGKAAITTYWMNFFKAPGLVFNGRPTHIEVAKSGDLAYERGTFKLTMNGPDGKPATQVGKYVVVWKRQPDGKWKAYADIFNADTK